MKFTKCLVVTFVTLLTSTYSTFASHILGSEISYEHVKDSTYDFYLTVYRDCSTIPLTISNGAVKLYCFNGGKTVDLDMSRISLTEITTKCDSAASECSPLDSLRSGDGVEQHVFFARVDFGSTKYSALASCGRLEVRFTMSSRPAKITTGASSSVHCNYLRTNLDNYKHNSSPVFSSTPITRINSNTPVYLDFRAVDKDGDSLSYHMAPALQGFFSNVKYSGNFSYKQPVTVYDPSGRGNVYPYAMPPHGFYLDELDGQIVFTATSAYQVPVIVVEVKEWRKDTNGYYRNIGSSFREVIPTIYGFSKNSFPWITNTSFSFSVCEGDTFALNLRSKDNMITGQSNPDTTEYSWNNSIPGASLVTIKDTLSSRNGLFTWVTKKGDAREQPYIIKITVSDGSCPLVGYTTKEFRINVAKSLNPTINKVLVSCDEYALKVQAKQTWDKSKKVWRLYDLKGNRITDRNLASFSNNLDSSVLDSVQLKMFKEGTYMVALDYANGGCNYTVLDTILYSGKLNLLLPQDTLICSDKPYTQALSQLSQTHMKNWSWVWEGDTTYTSNFMSSNRLGKNELHVFGFAKDGCLRKDSMMLSNVNKPVLSPLSDTTHCLHNPLTVKAINTSDSGYSSHNYLWSTGSKSQSIQLTATGTYGIKLQNQCGYDSTSFNVVIDTSFEFSLGKDQFLCDRNSINIGSVPRNQTSYSWSNGDTSSSIEVTLDGLYSIHVKAPCISHHDTVQIKFDKTPTAIGFEDYKLYCDTIDDIYDAQNTGFRFLWDDGTQNQTKVINRPGWHIVTVLSNHCGNVSDSTYAVFLITPDVDLGRDTGVKAPVSMTLDAGDHTNASYIWNTTDTSRKISINKHGLYWVEVTNVCGTDIDSIDIHDVVSITTINGQQILAYPNPASNRFYLEGIDDSYSITLTDLNGKAIKHTTEYSNDVVAIELHDYLPGVYTVILKSKDNNLVFKMLLH